MRNILSFLIKKMDDFLILIPNSDASVEFLKKKKNKEVFLTEYRYRILPHHRKFFAILNKFIDNIDSDLTIDDLLIYLKLKIGYYKEINFRGQKVVIPLSISFLEMYQTEFEEFYNKALRIMADILGISVKDLERESNNDFETIRQ